MKTFKEVRAPKIKKGLRDKKGKIHTVSMDTSGRKLSFKVTDEFGTFKTIGVKQLATMFESTSLNEVTDKEINAVKKLSKDMEKIKKDYFKIAKMGDKTLQSTKHNAKYKSILQAQQDVLKLIGDLSNQKMMQKESVEVLSEMAVSRKDFDKIKKNDVIEFVFDSSMKKGHKVKLKVKSKTRSAKYNVDQVNMVDSTDSRNKTKFTLFSRGGKDATLGWGGMGVVIKSYKIGVKEEVNEKLDLVLTVRGDKNVPLAKTAMKKFKGVSVKRQGKVRSGEVITFGGDEKQLQKMQSALAGKIKGLDMVSKHEQFNENYAQDVHLAQKNMARLAKKEKGQDQKDYMAVARALNQGNLGAVKRVIKSISTDEIRADILNVLVGYNDLIAKMYPKAVDAKGRLKSGLSVSKMIKEDGQYVSPNQMTDKQKQDQKDRIQRDRERRLKRMKAGQADSKADAERKQKERERNLRTFAGRKEAVDECKDEKDFKPHMMYDPKTGKGVKANTYADHVKYDKMGYTHEPVKEQNCGCGKTPCETYGNQNEARGYGKKPVSMMTPAEKKKDAERRKAYNAFQKKNRKEDMEEAMNPKDKAKRLAMIKKAVERINARNAEKAKKDALKMMKDSGMFDESVVTEAKASNIDQIRDIVKSKGAKKIGGVMVDMFTASAIVKVYDAINDTNKAKMDKMTVPAMANVAYKLISKKR